MSVTQFPTVFMDESGNTGTDLLNPEQPIQTVAAITMSADEAEDLLARHFPRIRARELKYSTLSRSGDGIKRALPMFREIFERGFGLVYVVDKRYALWYQLLDYIAEPAMHEAGVDFYDRGAIVSAASALRLRAHTLWGGTEAEAVLHAFQSAMRVKTPDAAVELAYALERIVSRPFGELFIPFLDGSVTCWQSLRIPQLTIALGYGMVVGLVSRIEKRMTSGYEVVHDNSPQIHRAVDDVSRLTGVDVSRSFRFSSVADLQFPLKLRAVGMADSRTDLRIQLADIVAGVCRDMAAAHIGSRPACGLEPDVLNALGEDSFLWQMAWPSSTEVVEAYGESDASEFLEFFGDVVNPSTGPSSAPPQNEA